MLRLKSVLLINALTSGATGILLIILNDAVARLFGSAERWPFVAVGVFLLLFSLLAFIQSRKPSPEKGWVKLIIALDVLWVVESIAILVPQLFGFTFIGYLLIAIIAAWVALMAFLQVMGLKKISLQ